MIFMRIPNLDKTEYARLQFSALDFIKCKEVNLKTVKTNLSMMNIDARRGFVRLLGHREVHPNLVTGQPFAVHLVAGSHRVFGALEVNKGKATGAPTRTVQNNVHLTKKNAGTSVTFSTHVLMSVS